MKSTLSFYHKRLGGHDITWASTRTSEKKAKWTTLLLIDSQAVKNTCNASIESKGFCFYKSTNGIKRHLTVDTLGFGFFTHCTKANVSDDQGLLEMLSHNKRLFSRQACQHSLISPSCWTMAIIQRL